MVVEWVLLAGLEGLPPKPCTADERQEDVLSPATNALHCTPRL